MDRCINIYCSCFVILVFISCNKEQFPCDDWINTCDDLSIHIDAGLSSRKVLIIGIDGFRPDAMQSDITPFLYELSVKSTTYYTNNHQVEQFTSTGPNWSSLLTGVHWCKHQVKSHNYSDNRFHEFPHFFKYIELADSSIKTASFVRWTPINEHITLDYADYANFSGTSDQGVYQAAEDMLLNQVPINPDVLFLHFLDLDAAGHGFGFHPDIPEYANTLAKMDGYVSSLVSIIETKRKDGEDWMIFVVSDHGGDGTDHHTYDNINNRYTIFFANHPAEEFIQSHKSTQADLVPTILDFMGITSPEFNCKTDGISLIN